MRTMTILAASGLVLGLAAGGARAQDARKPEEQPAKQAETGTKLSGKVFADFSWREIEDEGTGLKSSDSGTGIDVKRFYVGVAHTFDENWSANFVADIGDKGNPCRVTGVEGARCTGGDNRRYDIFVKNAYIQYKLSGAAMLRLGVAANPWTGYVEDSYGMRYVEQTLTDRVRVADTADWGLHFLGQSGMVKYAVSAVNGRGFSDPARSKGVDFEARLGVEPVKGLNIGIGGYSGKRGLDTEPQTAGGASPALHTAKRLDAMIGYVNEHLRVGAEWFKADNWFNVTTAAEDEADGWAAWAKFNVTPAFALFGRYDAVDPSSELRPETSDTYYNAGLEYKVNKALVLALVYKGEEVENGAGVAYQLDTGNARIGSTVEGGDGTFKEVGLYAQYSF